MCIFPGCENSKEFTYYTDDVQCDEPMLLSVSNKLLSDLDVWIP